MQRQRMMFFLVVVLVGLSVLTAVAQDAPPVGPPVVVQPEQPAQPAEQPAQPAQQPGQPAQQPAQPPIQVQQGPWQIADPSASLPEGPVDPDKTEVSIAFAKADIPNVLAFLSMASGVPIVVDGDLKGTITITSVRKVTLSLAYEIINSALRVRGYTMVGSLTDKMIRVVTLKKAIADRAYVQVGADINTIGTSDKVITQVIPLQYISAAKIREELKPLVADDQANLLAVSSSNTLIVTDTEGNVHRLLQIINLLDKDNTDLLEVEVYQCKNASAPILINSLEKVFGITSTTTANRPGQPGQQPGQQPNPNQPKINTDDGPLSLRGELRISADERTNAIIISASRPKINLVVDLVKRLDVNTTSEVSAKVFRLQYADATQVATQLNQIFEQPQGGTTSGRNRGFFFGGMSQQQTSASDYAGLKRNVIVADVRTNSVVVTATEQNMAEFERMIHELDAPNVLSDVARTFQLKYAKAPTLAQTLNQLFRGNTSRGFSFRDLFSGNNTNSQGDPIASLRNITVVADEKTNTLLITGPPQAFAMIEQIIAQLDKRTVQVFIEVAIVDVTLDDSTKFGIEWTWKGDSTAPDGVNPHTNVGTNWDLKSEKFGLRYSVISNNLQALLHALTTRSNVKVYSTPSITTADNVAARISIGRDEPFVSSEEETNNGNFRRTVAYKNVSISLNVTPHVSDASNMVALDVQQTINELIGRELELNAPIIANREARTTVMVNDGQTIVIGGIIKENTERQLKAVPFLSKIPGLGELFKSRTTINQQSELMVFLTPHILRDEASVDNITTEERGKLSDRPDMPGIELPKAPATPTVPAPPAPAATR